MRDHRECTRKNLRENFAFNLGLTLFLLLLILPFSAGATIFPFNSPAGQPGDYFGSAVAVDGDYAIFGATGAGDENGGRAYIYKYNGTSWQFLQELNPGTLDGGDLFGQTVDLSGDYAIIGAPGDDTRGGDAGRAYIFKRNFSDQWDLLLTDVLPVSNSGGDQFGSSVAIFSTSTTEAFAVVGAPFDNVNGKAQAGSIYFFSTNGTSIFTEGSQKFSNDLGTNDNFGRSVSLSQTSDNRTLALIGAGGALVGNNADAGATYVYERISGDWLPLSSSPKLVADDPELDAFFGASVSVDGDFAVIGAPFDDTSASKLDSGASYIFHWDGTSWSQTQKLTVADGAASDFFGVSVSVSGNYVIIGADGKDPSGAAYVFWFNGSTWELLKTIIDPNGTQLGTAVSVFSDGTNIFTIIGAPEGGGSALIDDAAGDDTDLNFAPSISFIEDQSVVIGNTPDPIPVTITDDVSVQSTGVDWQPLEGNIISNISLEGTGTNRYVEITLTPNQSGKASVTVSATDNEGASNEMTFTFAVTNPPIISDLPTEKTINEGESTGPIDFAVTDDATPASDLNITASSSNILLAPSESINLDEENTTISITPAAGQTGTATITIRVEDTTNGDVSTASFLLIVNGGPSITNILPADPSTQEDTTSATITVTVQDDEGGSLTLTAKSQDTGLVANEADDGPFFTHTIDGVSGGTPVDFTFSITPVDNANGTASIVVTAIDQAGGQSSKAFDFVITPVDDTPVIQDIALTTTSESLIDGVDDVVTISEDGQTPQIDILVTHGDGALLTVTVESANNASIRLNNLSTDTTVVDTTANTITTLPLVVTPVPDTSGTDLITVTVTEQGGANPVTETFTLLVTPANDPPVIEGITRNGASIVDEIVQIPEDGDTGQILVTVSDPDGGTLTVSVDSTNTTLLPVVPGNIKLGESFTLNQTSVDISTTAGDPKTVLLRLVPEPDQNGQTEITVRVTDAESEEFSYGFTLDVTPVNDAPTVIIPDEQRTVLEDGSVDINFTISDIDGDTNFTLSAASDNINLVPNANIQFSGSGTSRIMTITPTPDANSTNTGKNAQITVSAKDLGNETGTDYITIIVTPQADGPTISDISNQTINEGETALAGFNVSDIDSNVLIVTVNESSPSNLISSFNIQGTGVLGAGNTFSVPVTLGQSKPLTLVVTPNPGVFGQTLLNVTVSDGDPASPDAVDSFLLTIEFVNDLPQISDVEILYETQEDVPLILTYDDILTATLSCNPSAQNCFSICDVDSDFLKLELSSANNTLFPDQNIDISDGINDFGTFYIVQLKNETGCKQPNKDLELRFVPAENLFGSADITFTVEDSDGGITTGEFAIFVTAKEDPPIITGAPPLTAFVGEEYTFTPQASDPDAGDDSFLFSLERTDGGTLPDWLDFDSATGTIIGTPPFASDGTQIGLKIIATNNPPETDQQGQLLTDTLEFILTVDKNIGFPSISPFDEQRTNEDTRLDIPFTITEPNGDPVFITVESDNPDLIATDNITIIGEGITPNEATPENDFELTHSEAVTNLFLRLSPEPDANLDVQGIATITITAVDIDVLTETQPYPSESFDLYVDAQPDAPKLLDGAAAFPFNLQYKIDEGAILKMSEALPTTPSSHQGETVDFRVMDVDQQILTVSAVSDNKTLIPDANIKVFERNQEPGFEPFWIVTLDNSNEALMDMTIEPAPNKFGQAIITLAVNDSDGLSTQARFLVTVGNVPDAPEIVSIEVPTSPVPEESQTQIPFSIRDLDGDLLTLSATELDEDNNPVAVENGLFFSAISITGTGVNYDDEGNALIDVEPNVLTTLTLNLTGTANRTGTVNVRLTVSDGTGSDESTFSITISGVNDPPTIAAIPNYFINEDKAANPQPQDPTLPVPITLDDPDGDSLEISVTSGNQDLVKDSAFFLRIGTNQFALPQTITPAQYGNINLDLTPVKFANGTVKITVTVDDGTANPVSRSFNLTMNPIPNSPIISGITDQTMNEDDETPSNNPIPFTIRDPDGGTVTLLIHSDTPIVVPNDRSNMFAEGPVGVISDIINGVDTSGRNVVKVTMNLEANVETAFGLTVLPAENMFAENVPVNIELTVDDGETTPAVEQFALKILQVNDPPTVSQIVGPKFTLVNTPTEPIKFTIGDVETPPQDLIVNATSSNTTLVPLGNIDKAFISDGEYNYQIVISPFGGATGTANITVEVTDGNGLKDSTVFELVVQPGNTRKALIDTIDDKFMDEDSTLSFTFDVTFPLQSGESILNVLSLTAQSDNTDLLPNGSPYMVIQYDSSSSDQTVHTYRMTIDPPPETPWKGLDDTAQIVISATTNLPNSFTDQEDFIQTVIPVNDKPILSGITLGEQRDTYENVPLSFNFQVEDFDGDQLDIAYTSGNTNLIPLENILIDGIDTNGKVTPDHLAGATLKITLTPAAGRTGTVRIDITAKDGLEQDSKHFFVNILTSGSPIVSNVPLEMTVDKNDQDIPVFFEVSDPEGGYLTITATSTNTSVIRSTGLPLSIVTPAAKQLDANGRVFAEANELFQIRMLMTPVAGASGTADIEVKAVDESGKLDSKTLRLTVRAVKFGDVNNNGTVDLTDAILALKVLSGISPTGVDSRADVNNDDRIGLPEVIYILQYVAEMR